MAAKTIGIEIRSGAVHIALVSGGHILSVCSAPLPAGLVRHGRVNDPEALSRIIQALRKSHRIGPYPCVLVLPRELVSLRRLTLPRMDHKALMLNLPFEFRECSKDMVYGYSRPEAAGDPLLAVAANPAELRSYARLLRRAGLPLRGAIPEEAAWQNLLRGKPLPEAFGILESDGTHPCIHFFSGNAVQMTRELDMSQDGLSTAIRKAVNFYNCTLPMEKAAVARLYCREVPPEVLPGLELLPLPEFGSGEIDPACLLAAGGGMQLLSRHDCTINLFREEMPFHPRAVLPAALLLCTLLLCFVKFGILDPLDTRAQASTALAVRQEQLAQATARLEQFEILEQNYLRWGKTLLRPEEQALVSRTEVLALIRSAIAPHAQIADLILNGNALTMNLSQITLEEASLLMDSLESGPLVARAAVVSAAADDGRQANILISITLTNGEGT